MALYNDVLLGAVSLTPSSYSKNKKKIGESLEADNGTRRWVQAVDAGGAMIKKHTFDLEFGRVPDSKRDQLEALADTNSTFTYRDMNGDTFTVQIESEGYKEKWDFRHPNGTLYWTVSVTLVEA